MMRIILMAAAFMLAACSVGEKAGESAATPPSPERGEPIEVEIEEPEAAVADDSAAAPEEAAGEETGDIVIDDPAPDTGEDPSGGPSIPIGETDGMCGGIGGFACLNSGDYCQMEEGACVDIADAAGVCTVKPEACTREYNPVCGCDGKTYSNACSAAAAGVSVAAQGACKE